MITDKYTANQDCHKDDYFIKLGDSYNSIFGLIARFRVSKSKNGQRDINLSLDGINYKFNILGGNKVSVKNLLHMLNNSDCVFLQIIRDTKEIAANKASELEVMQTYSSSFRIHYRNLRDLIRRGEK